MSVLRIINSGKSIPRIDIEDGVYLGLGAVRSYATNGFENECIGGVRFASLLDKIGVTDGYVRIYEFMHSQHRFDLYNFTEVRSNERYSRGLNRTGDHMPLEVFDCYDVRNGSSLLSQPYEKVVSFDYSVDGVNVDKIYTVKVYVNGFVSEVIHNDGFDMRR